MLSTNESPCGALGKFGFRFREVTLATSRRRVLRGIRFTLTLTIMLPLCENLSAAAQEKVTLKATPATVAWGYYDAKAAPVLRIKSGDMVEIQTLVSNSPK